VSLPFGVKVIDNIIIFEDGYDAYGENGNMFVIHTIPYIQILIKYDILNVRNNVIHLYE